MPPIFTRADSLREFLTGALVGGGPQSNPLLSLGNYPSSTEACSLGFVINTPITGAILLYAGGANLVGNGTLTAVDSNHLTWTPPGSLLAGPPSYFSGVNDFEIVEANGQLGQYLRIAGTPPFSIGASTIVLSYLIDNIFAFEDVIESLAFSGVNEYRATIVQNQAANPVSGFKRWIDTLGTFQQSDLGGLPLAGGPGTIVTSGTFVDWPSTGWCQVRDSGGNLKEVVYYSSRTLTTLNVPGSGRALFTTSFAGGLTSDFVYPVPGVVIGLDPAGIQTSGSAVQAVVNGTTPPLGVTWNYGITAPTGLQIGSLNSNQQIGIWMWRQIPGQAKSTPFVLTQFLDSFNAF